MAGKARLGIACSVVLATAVTSAVCAEPAPATPTPRVGVAGIDPGLVLGGARTVAVDLLWLRADLRRSQGHTLELPALYNLIAELDPKNPLAWQFHGEVLIANLPLMAEGDPDGGWRYFREGLELLQRGRTHHPGDDRLALALAMHALRVVTERPAGWRAQAATVFGTDPLIAAAEILAPFTSGDRFETDCAYLLKHVLLALAAETDALGRTAEAAALREQAAALQTRLAALGAADLPDNLEHEHHAHGSHGHDGHDH